METAQTFMRATTQDFPRALLGYQPRAVQAALVQLDRHFYGREATVAAEAWDLYQIIDRTRPSLERLAALLPSEKSELSPPEPEPIEPSLPDDVADPVFQLPRTFWGYRPAAVDAELASRTRLWKLEIEERITETATAEAERRRMFHRLTLLLVRLKQITNEAGQVNEVRQVNEAGQGPANRLPGLLPGPLAGPVMKLSIFVPGAPLLRPATPRQAWRPGSIGETTASAPPSRRVHNAALAGRSAQLPLRLVAPAPAPAPALESPPTVENAHEQVREGLFDRMDRLYRSFLVGKALGADLLLPSGQLLAPKGRLITRELVQHASDAGLLPALIAHMTIPGLEID